MKKLLSVLTTLFLLSTVSFASNEFVTKISADIMGDLNYKSTTGNTYHKIGTKPGLEFNFYSFSSEKSNIGFGTGIRFGLEYKYDDDPIEMNFTSVPLFLSVKIRTNKVDNSRFYGVLNCGFNFMSGKIKDNEVSGDIYYGAGVGFDFSNIIIEANVSRSSFKTITSTHGDFDRISIMAGYKFNI